MLEIVFNFLKANYQLKIQENFTVDTHDHICFNVIRFYFYTYFYFFGILCRNSTSVCYYKYLKLTDKKHFRKIKLFCGI